MGQGMKAVIKESEDVIRFINGVTFSCIIAPSHLKKVETKVCFVLLGF